MPHASKLPKRFEEIPPADLKLAVKELGLSDASEADAVAREVRTLVYGLYELEWWLTSPRVRDRTAQLKYIKRIRNRLADLRQDFERADPGIEHTFGALLGGPLARILGPQGVAALHPEIAGLLPLRSGRELDRFLERRRRGESYESYVGGDNHMATMRVVSDHTVEILARLIDAIDDPLRNIVESEHGKRSGHPFRHYRRRVISRAAGIYWRATGEYPPKSEDGSFVDFCSAILDAVGLPSDSVGHTVKRQLSQGA